MVRVTEHLDALPPRTSGNHRNEARRVLEGFVQVCGWQRRNARTRLSTDPVAPALIDRYLNRLGAAGVLNVAARSTGPGGRTVRAARR